MGVIFQTLEQQDLARNTLVICTTDHGIAFPGMKCSLTDHGIGVMLTVRGPGGFTGGRAIDGMVSHIDLFPTICEVIGIDKPAWLQGTSILPLVRGETEQIRDEVFSEVSYHASYEPKRSVRTTRYKYIRNFGGRGRVVLPNTDDSVSKNLWMKGGWQGIPIVEEQLYDLLFDPNETGNLVAEPRMASVLDQMRSRLDNWMSQTSDPLLHGSVPPPADAVVNDPDAVSPADRPTPVTA
jgi:arylsulfatase A-like enzyme